MFYYNKKTWTQVAEQQVRNELMLSVETILPEHLKKSDYVIVDEVDEFPNPKPWQRVSETFDLKGSGRHKRKLSVVNEDNIPARKSHIAQKRYDVEVGGFEMSGMKIATDRHTQQVLSTMYMRATQDENYTMKFKTDNGFLDLDSAQIIQIAIAVHDFVQGAFLRESELVTRLDAGELVSGDDW